MANRIKATLLTDDGWTYKKIATALLLDEDTISLHIQEYLDSHKLKPENGRSKSKLNASQASELMAHLKAKPYMKIIDIVQYVKQTYGIPYTLSGMTYWLRAHGYSYKKPAATPSKANLEMQEIFIQ